MLMSLCRGWVLAVLVLVGCGQVEEDLLAAHGNRVVVDIRTEGEWQETGIVDGSVLLTFFDETGGYDAQGFVEALDRVLEERGNGSITLICRTGNRTTVVKDFLRGLGYDVEHVEGGIMAAIAAGLETAPLKR